MRIALPILFAAAVIASPSFAQVSNDTADAASPNQAFQSNQTVHRDQNDRDKTARDAAVRDCDPAAAQRMGPNDPSDPPASGYPATCRQDGN